MDLRDWLGIVGARNGSTPGGIKHYHGFSSKIRADFPRLPCTEATASDVAAGLGGQFPTWEELRGAIRRVMSELTTAPAPEDPHQPRPLSAEEAEARDARVDREWWDERIGRVASMTCATTAWREATGMLATLTRPDAYRRPWAIARLEAIIRNTAEAGADTDHAAVTMPRAIRLTPPPAPAQRAA